MKKDLHQEVCEEHVYSSLYEKISQGLHDFLYYKYGQDLNPGDKVQEAFIKLWENCKKVSSGKAKSYLYTVANNLMLNEIKHRKVVLNYKSQKPKNYTHESPEYLMEKEVISKGNFDDKIDWIYWELWHHEGRRARMGAAMMGPDYAWWHGIYDVAHNFYFKFIPEARHMGDDEVNAYIDELFANDQMHTWFNTNTADIKSAIKSVEFQKIYSELFAQDLE